VGLLFTSVLVSSLASFLLQPLLPKLMMSLSSKVKLVLALFFLFEYFYFLLLLFWLISLVDSLKELVRFRQGMRQIVLLGN